MKEQITQIELDRCHKVYDYARQEWFYQVESETNDLQEYEVRYDAKKHCHTCTCKSGKTGFENCKRYKFCKHVRWSIAHSKLARMEEKEQGVKVNVIANGELQECSRIALTESQRREAYCNVFAIY